MSVFLYNIFQKTHFFHHILITIDQNNTLTSVIDFTFKEKKVIKKSITLVNRYGYGATPMVQMVYATVGYGVVIGAVISPYIKGFRAQGTRLPYDVM